jgi:hypothetical protein
MGYEETDWLQVRRRTRIGAIAMVKPASLVIVLGLIASLFLLRPASADSKYRGFTIIDSQVLNMEKHDELLAATKEQIDIVYEVGLSAEVLTFFQSVPFELVPAGTIRSPGRYAGKLRGVQVASSIIAEGHKPILLHELLHAYHDQRIEAGFRNPDIIKYFGHARWTAAFAPRSHMMQNEQEFFACAATTYLFGVTAQEPFQRGKLKTSQPEFFTYLKTLFGPTAGSYTGSLTKKGK